MSYKWVPKLLIERDACLRREEAIERRLWRALHWVRVLRCKRDSLREELARLETEQQADYQDVAEIVEFADRARDALEPFARAWASVCEAAGATPGNGAIVLFPNGEMKVPFNINWCRDAWRTLTHFPKPKDDKMAFYEYTVSGELQRRDIPFYALIMAAMRRADSHNLELLKSMFPETWEELQRRYHSPGGRLEHEQE